MIADIDKDGSGNVNFEEFLDMMTAKMVCASASAPCDCMVWGRREGGGRIDRRRPRWLRAPLPSLLLVCHNALQTDKDTREDILKVFSLFDVEGKGKITIRDLKRVAKELGETMTGEPRAPARALARHVGAKRARAVAGVSRASTDRQGHPSAGICAPLPTPLPSSRLAACLSPHCPGTAALAETELAEMIERADTDADGEVTAEDFYNIMTKKTFSA